MLVPLEMAWSLRWSMSRRWSGRDMVRIDAHPLVILSASEESRDVDALRFFAGAQNDKNGRSAKGHLNDKNGHWCLE